MQSARQARDADHFGGAVEMVADAAILCGLGLIYLAMIAMIIGLGRILAGEQDMTGSHRTPSHRA